MKEDEEKEKEIVMYATGKDGNGFVQVIGRFYSVDEIEIRVGLFDKDTLISFEIIDKEK